MQAYIPIFVWPVLSLSTSGASSVCSSQKKWQAAKLGSLKIKKDPAQQHLINKEEQSTNLEVIGHCFTNFTMK